MTSAGRSWAEIREPYDRAPVLFSTGIAALGVGAAALAVGIIWAAVGDGDDGGDVELGLGPAQVHLRGSF